MIHTGHPRMCIARVEGKRLALDTISRKPNMIDISIATISEAKLGWGALLLIASLRRHGIPHPVEVFMTDSSEDMERCLTQFGNVFVRRLDMRYDARNPCLRKPEALLSLKSEYLAWFDNDCMAIGDISNLLSPSNGEFQIRMREQDENAEIFGSYYESGETKGPVPAAILVDWCKDVGERTEPRFVTKCVANAIVLHRRHRGLLERWQQFNDQIFPKRQPTGVVDRSNISYFMADESALSAVLAYAHDVPPISKCQFDIDPNAFIAHFSLRPKPWERWQWRHWRYYDAVLDLINWCRRNGYELPPLPRSFDPRLKIPNLLLSASEYHTRKVARKFRSQAANSSI